MKSSQVLVVLTAGFLVAYCGPPACSEGGSPSNSTHETHCDQYYECSANGTRSLGKCPPRWMFDSVAKVCQRMTTRVDCSNRPYSDPAYKVFPVKQRPQCVAGTPVRFYPHQSYCDAYYKCENGTESMGQCPNYRAFDDRGSPEELNCGAYAYFYSNDSYCAPRPLYSATPSRGKCPRADMRWQPDKDCDIYWECHSTYSSPAHCTFGEMFDPSEEKCKPPQKVKGAGQNCDMKYVPQVTCPQTDAWEASKYANREWAPWQVQHYLDSSGTHGRRFASLPHPRVSFGHCELFFECVPDDANTTRRVQRLESCRPLVLEPNTLQCVDWAAVPECKDYYYKYETHEAYRLDVLTNEYRNLTDYTPKYIEHYGHFFPDLSQL